MTTSLARELKLFPKDAISAEPINAVPIQAGSERKAVSRHRIGVNYTPSNNWWYCWNDWNVNPIKRDLDAIAALGADHLRILLIWPYFQPNLTWVSAAHLERLSELLALMGERSLDALVTVFTGQLSGWLFLPPFNKPDPALYTDPEIWAAQELLIEELARTMKAHDNLIGFDFGNEMNTCWSAEPAVGDAWMVKMFALMNSAYPSGGRPRERDRSQAVVSADNLFSAGAGCQPLSGCAHLSLLDECAEVRRPHGPTQYKVARRLRSSGPLLCRRSSEASLGRRVQHLY
jgi:hypothetical protein